MRPRRLFLTLPLLTLSAIAFAASVPSGTVSTNVNVTVAVPASGNVLSAQNLPVQVSQSLTYTAGTAANQVNKVATVGGTATASPASIDLTSVVCVDGQVGFSHIREVIAYDDDATNGLLWDFTATNALTAMFSAGGTTAKLTVQPGAHQRFAKPLGTNGYVVDSTHKIVSLDPGANTIAYRVIILGD